MSDDREGLDALQGDMAAHQARFVGMPSAEQNRMLAVAEFERIDRATADAPPSIAPAPSLAAAAPPVVAEERREIDGKGYLISKGADSPLVRKSSPREYDFIVHAMPRIELLLTKKESGAMGQPSWYTRTWAVMEIKSRVSGARAAGRHDIGDELDRRFFLELMDLLEASNAAFGDWKADAPTKVTIG